MTTLVQILEDHSNWTELRCSSPRVSGPQQHPPRDVWNSGRTLGESWEFHLQAAQKTDVEANSRFSYESHLDSKEHEEMWIQSRTFQGGPGSQDPHAWGTRPTWLRHPQGRPLSTVNRHRYTLWEDVSLLTSPSLLPHWVTSRVRQWWPLRSFSVSFVFENGMVLYHSPLPTLKII